MNNILNLLKKKQIMKYKNIPKNLKIGNIINLRMILSKYDKRYKFISGYCIGIKKKSNQSSFILKNLIHNEIIYKSIPLYSNLILNFKIKKTISKINFSKIYNYPIKHTIR
jgi:ribosomal protein L19